VPIRNQQGVILISAGNSISPLVPRIAQLVLVVPIFEGRPGSLGLERLSESFAGCSDIHMERK
jgi:hypothetical protein